jgi:broad-specificity NMP kinase
VKLIIIYGAPATGKLTVATELSRLTGYKVFHNHISIDFAKTVFDFGTPAFWRLVAEVRFDAIAEAAREGLSLIHTFCYEFGADDEHFSKLIASAEDNGGDAHLVLLRCDDEERKNRIGNESRIKIGKLVDPEHIDRSTIELSTPFPGRETLICDTTETPAETVAARIVEHFGLQTEVGDL